MARIERELSEVVTVKLGKEMLQKLDHLAIELHRSRADTVRRLIAGAVVTGQPDVTANLPCEHTHDAA